MVTCLQRVLQEVMWEFGLFQICHPSHTDKLFRQFKQGHTHTACDMSSALVLQHLSVLFYCSVRLQKRGNAEKQAFCQCLCIYVCFDVTALFLFGAV